MFFKLDFIVLFSSKVYNYQHKEHLIIFRGVSRRRNFSDKKYFPPNIQWNPDIQKEKIFRKKPVWRFD